VPSRKADSFTYLDQAQFPKLFAPDLPRERVEFVARSQVLPAAEVFSTPLTAVAWKTKPSWGVVAENDKIINPDIERCYYAKAQSHTTGINGASHSVFESHPNEVAAVITSAAPPAPSEKWRPAERLQLLTDANQTGQERRTESC
jgi:pimeloyl-ACP methyl ester carboxylesterase